MAYIVRSFTPCFTLWFDVGICSLRDTSHNVYPTDVYPFSWVQLMSPLSLALDEDQYPPSPHALSPATKLGKTIVVVGFLIVVRCKHHVEPRLL